MKTERTIEQVRAQIQHAWASRDAKRVQELSMLMLTLQADRIRELEKINATKTLEERYKSENFLKRTTPRRYGVE